MDRELLEAALWRIWPTADPIQVAMALAAADAYAASEIGRRTERPTSPLHGRPLKPCGTASAYRRHVRRGEPVDAACRRAHADEVRFYAQARAGAA